MGFGRLALHTWTLDTRPLPDAIVAAREGGFDALELRRIDFTRCYEHGMPNGAVLDMLFELRSAQSGAMVATAGGGVPRGGRGDPQPDRPRSGLGRPPQIDPGRSAGVDDVDHV